MSYTKGPWSQEGRTIYALDDRGRNNRFSCRVEGGYEVKSAFQARATSSEELEANARLISAAPELLEALQEVIREKAPAYHDCVDNGEPECAWCIARAAIAKATGAGA